MRPPLPPAVPLMRRLVIFSLLLLAMAQGISIPAAAQTSSEGAARGPFSETELIKGLAGGMSTKRLVTLVGEYGVDFSLTPESEGRLRAVGADDELLEAIRQGKAKPLSENDLLKRLAGGTENRRLATLVSQYGAEFSLTPEIEERLRAAGANDELMAAIRKAKPTPKTPAPGETKVNPKDGLSYVWIPPGTFMMGCSPGDGECFDPEKPAHAVTIRKGFWMGQTEVTQAAYQRVTGANPGHFRGDRMPVEQVTWHDANAYCSAVGMRLPTEAEWEYAARAGSAASRNGDLDAIAWFADNSGNQRINATALWQSDSSNYGNKLAANGNRTHEAGQRQPNAWKLYDMLGNVWEWTNDWYDENYYGQSPSQDPPGPSAGQWRVLRGGSWYDGPRYVRVSYRLRLVPGGWDDYVYGFRCGGEVP